MLMNSIALESTDDLTDFGEARAVDPQFRFAGYRPPDHRRSQGLLKSRAKSAARSQRYEPRLDAGIDRRAPGRSSDGEALKLRFLVEAQLFCQPINIPVEFVADVDFDSGEISVSRT